MLVVHPRSVLLVVLTLCSALVAGGCAGPNRPADDAPTPPPAPQPAPEPQPASGGSSASTPVATINGQAITLEELARPLIEADGLRTLLYLVQLDIIRQAAAKQGIAIATQDVRDEFAHTMLSYFPTADEREYDTLLDDLLPRLTPQGERPITRPQFYISMQANAYLRKMVWPAVEKAGIGEPALKQLFAIRYGQQVQVRCIVVGTRQEAERAKVRLAAGEKFAAVAADMNKYPELRNSAGEYEPFTINSPNVSEPIKNAAFALKDNQISDIILGKQDYFILLMEKHIEPKVVKFESVKDILKHEMDEGLAQDYMSKLRTELFQTTLQGDALVILDAELRDQYEKAKGQQAKSPDWKEILRRQNQGSQNRSSTGPATRPEARERPPATGSGTAPDHPPAKAATAPPVQQ